MLCHGSNSTQAQKGQTPSCIQAWVASYAAVVDSALWLGTWTTRASSLTELFMSNRPCVYCHQTKLGLNTWITAKEAYQNHHKRSSLP